MVRYPTNTPDTSFLMFSYRRKIFHTLSAIPYLTHSYGWPLFSAQTFQDLRANLIHSSSFEMLASLHKYSTIVSQ